jgi:hypothetical protein
MSVAATATNKLPLHAAMVAPKTPVATVMAGAQTTINNQLKLVAAMAMEMATMTATTKNEKEDNNGGDGSLAAARRQWRWQHGVGGGSSTVAA